METGKLNVFKRLWTRHTALLRDRSQNKETILQNEAGNISRGLS